MMATGAGRCILVNPQHSPAPDEWRSSLSPPLPQRARAQGQNDAMLRLMLFFVGLALWSFSLSARLGLWLCALAALVWCGCTAWAVAQLLFVRPPHRGRRRR